MTEQWLFQTLISDNPARTPRKPGPLILTTGGLDPGQCLWVFSSTAFRYVSTPACHIRDLPGTVDFSPTATRSLFRGFARGLPVWAGPVLPEKAHLSFRAWESEGRTYYEDLSTGSVTWCLPGVGPSAEDVPSTFLRPGCAVELRMAKWPLLESAGGRVVAFFEGKRVLVHLPDFAIDVLVPLENLRPLSRGRLVKFTHPKTNLEAYGVLRRAAQHKVTGDFVYDVEVSDSGGLASLTVWPGDVDAGKFVGMKASPPEEYLVYTKNEQQAFFLSEGVVHEFSIHFPLSFQSLNQKLDMGQVAQWPLLVYLHGAGGGSFLSYSKKALRQEGTIFAAENFIIISPHCKWKWKQQPQAWVLDLIEEFGKVPYVDPTRIYLTGISMGGMGTWQLAAQRTWLFAGIAPIAAYHDPEQRRQIAQALRSMPIFVVHSSADGTTPLEPEKRLYEELQSCGAKDLRVDVGTLDHCHMFQAYNNTPHIYEWLLLHRNEAFPEARRFTPDMFMKP
ncbi:unnamed protein product [Effrenium voratum]|nr:unnamed protein product [Effrenium voratum]